MTIKAVFFDFGGVILEHADGIDHKAIEARLGLEERTLFHCMYMESRYRDFQVGGCTEEEWLESIRAAAVARIGPERAEELMEAWQSAERPLNKEMLALIERLRAADYKTGIISNTTPKFEERLQEAAPHLIPMFDVRVGSGDVKLAKPDPGIFHHAMRELGVEPEASVFTDDVRAYAEAATALGMRGFHFQGYERFAEDLRSIGVDV